MPLILVAIPTVLGRQTYLEETLAAYATWSTCDLEIVVLRDRPTCGAAWVEAVERSGAEYVHLTADDVCPIGPGWDLAAIETVRRDAVPAPTVWRVAGLLESSGGVWGRQLADWEETTNTCVVPFCSRSQWEHMVPWLDALKDLHYWSDNLYSFAARCAGYPVVVRDRYEFIHRWAQPGRGAGMTQEKRMAHDQRIYDEAVSACFS